MVAGSCGHDLPAGGVRLQEDDACSDAGGVDAYDADAGAGGFYARCGYTEVGRVTYRGVPHVYYEHVLG